MTEPKSKDPIAPETFAELALKCGGREAAGLELAWFIARKWGLNLHAEADDLLEQMEAASVPPPPINLKDPMPDLLKLLEELCEKYGDESREGYLLGLVHFGLKWGGKEQVEAIVLLRRLADVEARHAREVNAFELDEVERADVRAGLLRLAAAGLSSRTRAEAELGVLKVMLKGAEERGRIVLEAKTEWADRARLAESELAALKARAELLEATVEIQRETVGAPDEFLARVAVAFAFDAGMRIGELERELAEARKRAEPIPF